MGDYVQLGDVRTYYETDGAGEPLVLLHPGGADSRAFETNLPGLAEHFRVYRPDRRGHGRTPDVPGPISYEQMAWDTVAFLEQAVGGPAYVLGHSDGAPVGLLAARLRPNLVRRLVFASGVFHHEGWLPGAIDLDAESMEFFVGYHGEVSPDGPGAFRALSAKLDRMHLVEPTLTVTDLARIATPTLVMMGDDEEVSYDHIVALRTGLADAQLAIVPGTGHGVLMDRPELCNMTIREFLTADADH